MSSTSMPTVSGDPSGYPASQGYRPDYNQSQLDLVSNTYGQGSYPSEDEPYLVPERVSVSYPSYIKEDNRLTCSKVMSVSAIVLLLGLAITGALALVGSYCPDTSLVVLADAIGSEGAIAMLAIGVSINSFILLSYFCGNKSKPNTYQHLEIHEHDATEA
jgi:hypothetical protein